MESGVVVLRVADSYEFNLVDRGPQVTTPIPCRIEIVTHRHVRIDGHNFVPSAASDARLPLRAYTVIASYVDTVLEGQQFDGPIPGLGINGHTDHVPEVIAVWAYWLARDLLPITSDPTRLVVESARVIIAGRMVVEYVPEEGDR